jgi:hypothetical protein
MPIYELSMVLNNLSEIFSLQILPKMFVPKNFIQNLYHIKKLRILQKSLIYISFCRS